MAAQFDFVSFSCNTLYIVTPYILHSQTIVLTQQSVKYCSAWLKNGGGPKHINTLRYLSYLEK